MTQGSPLDHFSFVEFASARLLRAQTLTCVLDLQKIPLRSPLHCSLSRVGFLGSIGDFFEFDPPPLF